MSQVKAPVVPATLPKLAWLVIRERSGLEYWESDRGQEPPHGTVRRELTEQREPDEGGPR